MQSPRFWLEPTLDAVLCDEDHLAFELSGFAVKALTEDDYFKAGNVKHTGKANPLAQKWANQMTAKYAELAVADPIFGHLRNCMNLAVVGAIIEKYELSSKAGNDFAALYADSTPIRSFVAPKQTPSIASIKERIVTVSGGVAIPSWKLVEKTKDSAQIAPVRKKASSATNGSWWSNLSPQE
jgi:hypothetical protein